MPAGRPAKQLDDDQKAQVEALAAFLSQDQIADYFGIARNTLAAMIERDPEISERYKRGKAKAIAKVASSLLQAALNGSQADRFFYLKTQAGWRETNHVDHTSSDGTMTPKHLLDVSKLSTEALAEIVNASAENQP